MKAAARFAFASLALGGLAVAFGSGARAAVVPWNDPTLPFGISTPSGVHYLFGQYSAEAATADGAGGAFVNGVQAVILDAEPVSIGVSGLASDSAIAAAATLGAPDIILAAAVAAGLDLAAQGLSVSSGGVFETSAGSIPNSYTCVDGTQAYGNHGGQSNQTLADALAYDSAHDQTVTGVTQTNVNLLSVYGYYTNLGPPSGQLYAMSFTCGDGSEAQLSGPVTPATQPQVESAVDNALKAKPSAAPVFADKLAQDGYPPSVVIQTPTGPSAVTGSPTTSTTTSGPSGSTTTTTKTCTPTDNLSYGPGAVSVSQTVSCTTTVTPPAGSASAASSSATTTTTPPTTSASSTSDTFVPPTSVVPSVPAVPPGTINVPVPTIDNSGGTCPAPLVLNLGLPGVETMNLDLTPWCNLAAALRPWVLTLGGIVAAVVVVR